MHQQGSVVRSIPPLMGIGGRGGPKSGRPRIQALAGHWGEWEVSELWTGSSAPDAARRRGPSARGRIPAADRVDHSRDHHPSSPPADPSRRREHPFPCRVRGSKARDHPAHSLVRRDQTRAPPSRSQVARDQIPDHPSRNLGRRHHKRGRSLGRRNHSRGSLGRIPKGHRRRSPAQPPGPGPWRARLLRTLGAPVEQIDALQPPHSGPTAPHRD